MNQVVRRLWLWLWYLLPANPILVRVVHNASRQPRHLWLRVGYLAALLVVVIFSLFLSISGHNASLTELAKGASQTFKWAAGTQLALMCFLAPVFTAGAITQEQDAQTFNILLSTPLSNAQIVFGSLMSRLYFVMLLLAAGLPIFLLTMVYGGVTTSQIMESFALAGSTAILTGALAIFIAMLGVGTRRTIFSFYVLIGLYLLLLYLLGRSPHTWVDASPANIAGEKMSWLTPLHPFLSLEVALNQIHAPPYGYLANRSMLARYALAYPSVTYVTWTMVLAFLLTLTSIFFVRRSVKAGEPTLVGSILDRLKRYGILYRTGQGRTRPPRPVWANPVAWREAKTRASGGALVRWAIIVAGAVASLILLIAYAGSDLPVADVRQWLAQLVTVQFAITLIIATTTAATGITREKESNTLDLLLTTPLTSKYILWGKLRGLVSFAIPLLGVPVLAVLGFGLYGLVAGESPPVAWPETALELAVLMTVFTAGACVIGLKVSLNARKNVTAIMYSVGTLILVCAILSGVGFALTDQAGGHLGGFFAPFTPFTAVVYLTDPVRLFANSPDDFAANASATRTALLIGSAVAAAIYAFIVWSAYTGLVRAFDMTLRKQSGT